MGVDVRDPAQVLVVMKRLGAGKCEELFAPGERDDGFLRGKRPVLETDLVRETNAKRDQLLSDIAAQSQGQPIRGMKVVVASTDVHEFAKFLLTSTFEALQANVIDCGINRDPEDIVKVVAETAPHAVVLTTHNGVARTFATKLLGELQHQRLDTPVFMGGVLNEDVEGSDVPIDVRADLVRLGVGVPGSVDELVDALRRLHLASR
ncbi:MAG: cobalamin B12-binding domain-containing protein [Actinobacteria bacterium]|nr:cobalamin B12-binding domain-containing protein [Actinomycetota bacterium]